MAKIMSSFIAKKLDISFLRIGIVYRCPISAIGPQEQRSFSPKRLMLIFCQTPFALCQLLQKAICILWFKR